MKYLKEIWHGRSKMKLPNEIHFGKHQIEIDDFNK